MAVRNFMNRLKFWKRTVSGGSLSGEKCSDPEYQLANKLKLYEKYISEAQNIIMWDNPVISLTCVLIVNSLFWILASLQWRFYGILSTVLLAVLVHDGWHAYVWPEIRVPQPTSPESFPDVPSPSVQTMSKHLTCWYARVKQATVWLRNLRSHQPALFCCISVLGCSTLFLLGQSVSGFTLVYSLLMSTLLVPGLYTHCISHSLKTTVAQHVSCVQQAFARYSAGEVSDDEYLPVTTNEDLVLLTRASDLHNDTYDSLTNPDLLSGLDMIPSHEEDSLATLSDFEPGATLPLDNAEDSDSNPDDHQIQFRSGHFNGESSSSDEEAFSRDLVFSEADERDLAVLRGGISSFIAQTVTSNLASSSNIVGLLANVIRPTQSTTERRLTDSDLDDFEIINAEDLGNQDGS